MKKLEEIIEEKGNIKLESDLEDWKYLLEHPEEEYTQEIIIYDEKPSFFNGLTHGFFGTMSKSKYSFNTSKKFPF
jgi:hypothetical protein